MISEQALLQLAHQLAGLTLGELADRRGVVMPTDLKREKGWVGVFVESLLGATAGSDQVPDFEHLGIELKTLPLDAMHQPKESTFVTTAALIEIPRMDWQQSHVRAKLAKVLWIPIEADDGIPLPKRRLGRPILWSPSPDQEAILRQDWEEFAELITLGQAQAITGYQGTYLQMRPKAANAHVLTTITGPSGDRIPAQPRGFYLRTVLTRQLLGGC